MTFLGTENENKKRIKYHENHFQVKKSMIHRSSKRIQIVFVCGFCFRTITNNLSSSIELRCIELIAQTFTHRS